MNKPIYAQVPQLPADLPDAVRVADPPAKPKRDNRWKKGLPRGTTKAQYDAMQARGAALAPALPAPSSCAGCGQVVAPLSLEMLRELIRVARDRLAEHPEGGRTDVLYFAARVDGYCSLTCWRHHAPEAIVEPTRR